MRTAPAPATRLTLALALAAALASCAPMPPAEAPKPVAAPQITEDTLRQRAREQLAAGVKLYEAGDYEAATKSLSASLDHGLLDRTEQSRARKYLAFIHCLGAREAQCAAEFRKAFEIDPSFVLTAAEDGHPIWGPVYRNVRATLIAEREAAQGKPKAALPPAEQKLVDGLVKYEAGEFAEAYRLLTEAHKEGLREKKDQVRALKHAAFCLCLQSKWRDCRNTFISIYDIDPDFDLTPAEAGHPSWTKTFAGAKAQAKKALADKARAEAAKKKTP